MFVALHNTLLICCREWRVASSTIHTSNMNGRHRGPKRKLRAGYRATSLQRTSHAPSLQRASHVAMRFHRRVWYRALSLPYACIRRSGIILIPRLPL